MAQLHSAEKDNKPLLHLTYSTPGFHSSSRLLPWVPPGLRLTNACKFGQGHMERLQEIQDLPGLFHNSIFGSAHQDPEPDPVENNKSLHRLQQGALERVLIIVFSAGFFTNSINFNSKYLKFESFFIKGEKLQAKKVKKKEEIAFSF